MSEPDQSEWHIFPQRDIPLSPNCIPSELALKPGKEKKLFFLVILYIVFFYPLPWLMLRSNLFHTTPKADIWKNSMNSQTEDARPF